MKSAMYNLFMFCWYIVQDWSLQKPLKQHPVAIVTSSGNAISVSIWPHMEIWANLTSNLTFVVSETL